MALLLVSLCCAMQMLATDSAVCSGAQRKRGQMDSERWQGPHVTWVQVYSPCRTVVAYAPSEFVDKDAERSEYGVPGLAVAGLGPYFEL